MSKLYAQSGVDIEKGYEAVERMKKHIARTHRPEVLSQLGSFGGLFALNQSGMQEPVLVSGTDGVGTKILLAQQSGKLDTVGVDCVAMCVNDILAQGAQPLFFLDYLAVGKNDPISIEKIVSGVADGCEQAGCALIGGETAEMPDLYAADEFDLAGFSVGIVDKQKMLDGTKVVAGDVLIGLPSSGVHSNGFSLVRQLFFKQANWSFETSLPNGKTLIDELLTPTRIYVKDVLPLVQEQLVHGIAHITGGGFYENVPRMYREQVKAEIDTSAWELPTIFTVLQELGQLDWDEMYHVFNMGIGLVLAVAPEHVDTVCARIPDARVIGRMSERAAGEPEIMLSQVGEA